MSLITKEIEMKWNKQNIDWYKSKGYIFTKLGDKFWIQTEDLQKGSNKKINAQCDNCGKELKNTKWQDYLKCVKEDDKYYCNKCAMKLFSGLSKRLSEKEIKNIISKNLGIGWKITEIKRIKGITHVDLIDNEGYMYSDINIHSIKNNHIPYKFHQSNKHTIQNINYWCQLNNLNIRLIENQKYKDSTKKLNWKCLECNNVFKKTWNNVSQGYISCSNCSDNISYPNKFGRNMFEQLNIEFIPEYISSWTKNFRYDFGFNNLKIVIEFHGLNHYEGGFETFGGRTLEKEQANDRIKKELAEINSFKYIEIDCRKSNIEWIKNSILNSKLNTIFDLNKIDWLQCHKFALNNLIKQACNLWNSGIESTTKIGKIIKLHRVTIVKYLKQGKKMEWCNYNEVEVRSKALAMGREITNKINNCNNKIVLQFTLNNEFIKEYKSIKDATRQTGIGYSSISKCCCNKQKTTCGFKWAFKKLSTKIIL
jgi:hypothetical protein